MFQARVAFPLIRAIRLGFGKEKAIQNPGGAYRCTARI